MNVRKIIERRIHKRGKNVDVQADVNAVVAANVGERGSTTSVSSTQTATARQGRTEDEIDSSSSDEKGR